MSTPERLNTARKTSARAGGRRSRRPGSLVAEQDGRERVLAFDVSALAERSQAIDPTAAWTCESFVVLMRTLLERGIYRRET